MLQQYSNSIQSCTWRTKCSMRSSMGVSQSVNFEHCYKYHRSNCVLKFHLIFEISNSYMRSFQKICYMTFWFSHYLDILEVLRISCLLNKDTRSILLNLNIRKYRKPRKNWSIIPCLGLLYIETDDKTGFTDFAIFSDWIFDYLSQLFWLTVSSNKLNRVLLHRKSNDPDS